MSFKSSLSFGVKSTIFLLGTKGNLTYCLLWGRGLCFWCRVNAPRLEVRNILEIRGLG
jgi:hypothetical protein